MCLQQINLVPFLGDDDYGLTLSNHRLQDFAILIFKAVNGMLPGYISDLFVVRNNVKCLRCTNTVSYHSQLLFLDDVTYV